MAPHLWYGLTNVFSGQSLYDSLMYQEFNIFFASLPIIVYAIYDKEHSEETLLSCPSLYYDSQQNKHFTNQKYWKWFVLAFYEAFIFYLFTTLLMSNGALGSSGHLSSFWINGNIIYLTVVITINLKVLILSNQYSILLILMILGSVFCFFVSHYIFNLISTNTLHSTYSM